MARINIIVLAIVLAAAGAVAQPSLRGVKEAASEAVGETVDAREAVGDAYGAGSAVGAAAVRARGTGTASRTPLEEFEARPRDEARCVWTAVMFLTRLPCPGWCDHHPGYLMRALCYFPLLGTVIGAWQASIYDAAASLWPPLVAAALSAAGTLWLTGCFHEDGLCDTLDGFGGGWTRSEILKIMRDSRSGSYATVGAGLWCLATCAAIAVLGPSVWALRVGGRRAGDRRRPGRRAGVRRAARIFL